ncbi:hypothetical protein Trco_007460 [Trichoderma cornu-damae]|uniref:Uncharacterized protein n=1 Tax=Trichoderma cornu-damae TaxID=654480 RepID=A0A9P8TUC9_9HYPO|nr:hypothetical protein Trco_007460 [Trichoderma cornu-damae]
MPAHGAAKLASSWNKSLLVRYFGLKASGSVSVDPSSSLLRFRALIVDSKLLLNFVKWPTSNSLKGWLKLSCKDQNRG